MSGRLVSIPSLKYKRKKRPSRTLSQQAPLANYDEFQLSDISDSEDNSKVNNHPASAPINKLQHFHSSDETNCDKKIPPIIDTHSMKNTFSKKVCEDDAPDAEIDIEIENEIKDDQKINISEETISPDVTKDEIINENIILEEDEENKEEYIEEEEEDVEDCEDNNANQNNSENDENQECISETSKIPSVKNGECSEIDHVESEYNQLYNEECDLSKAEEEDKEENDLKNDDVYDDMLISMENNSDFETVAVSEYSGIATEPNTPNDQSMDEYSQKAEELMSEDLCDRYQREEYYDYVEEPVIHAGDDPFSLEYHHTKNTLYQPYSENNEPPQIVITEPSDQDLTTIDGSKVTKPSRPQEPPKSSKLPKRPPPPPGGPKAKSVETELRTIPPPPSSVKRREKKNETDSFPDKQTKFPFKTHFEKKPLVPNPKKAILNVLKGESKKERKRRKAEEEFERILNTVDPEEAPLCDSTDEWKAYKDFNERISASVQKSQEKIKSLLEEEILFKEDKEKYEKEEEIVEDNSNLDWTSFEDRHRETNKEPDIVEVKPIPMSAINENKLDDLDIWGCDNDKPDESFSMNFEEGEATFVETFNQRIEETDDDFLERSNSDYANNTADNLFIKFDEDFESISTKPDIETSVVQEANKLTENIRKERPKPQRQETLSGNNPFRKASLKSEEEMTEVNKEDESPFIAVLKSAGFTDLEEPAPGFDPLTTIYPDSGDEKPSSNEDDLSSQSSNDAFQPFKITTKIKMIDPVTTDAEPVKLLPSPNVSTPKGPRERKLPPESKPFSKIDKNIEVENLFDEIRSDDNKNFLEIDEEQNVIRFDSPLSGKFASERIEWEAFPSNKFNEAEDEAVWGEDTNFKLDFEPLPGEIVTFEPYHPKNENMEWKLLIRQPEKKSKAKQISRYTSNRWWKETYLRLASEKDRPCLRFYDNLEDSEPYRVIRLEPYMQLSRDKLQQYDKYGKLQIFKINHVVYKEMVGMRTEKFSFKTLQNLVSHKPKINMVLDHMPLRTEIVKIGSLDQKPLRSLMTAIEDAMMSIKSHRDASLEYTKEEVCCYVNDEYECVLNYNGSILSQKARTRILFAAFVVGNPHIVLGINDKWRFGNEIVRRQDIIPIMHDDWINIYEPEFHSCIDMNEYEKDHMIKFYPLDGCKFELMRFRVPLRPNKELPLSADAKIKINGVKIDIRVDLSVPGFFSASKRHGAVHCDDIEIRIPIPEEWAYHFRIEKHTKYGSMHSALRKPGKIKGFERITQIAQSFLPPSMLEASAGVAKYEHLYRSIVWRIPRLPEKNEASYKPHMMTCKFILAPHDNVPPPDEMIKQFVVEFTMAASTVSGATVRSISVEHTTTPERFVKYLGSFKYSRDISYEWGDIKPAPIISILDQNTESLEEPHSSDESHQEKSSPSENTNSPPKPQKNDSVDLLECSSDINPDTAQSHSAYDDLLTLDCFNKPSVNNEYSSGTGISLSGNLMDDIAMVDDEHED